MGSLRTADAFPVVASLPPKNFRREVEIERSDDGNASAVRRLGPGGQEIVIGKLYKDISI